MDVLAVRLGAGIGHAVSLPALAGLGLFVGYVAGMFGVGGGFLLTPLLLYGFGVPAPIAVGSALCQKCGTAIAAFLKYRSLERGEPRIDLVMLGGSLLGVDAGTRLLTMLSGLGNWRIGSGPGAPAVNVVLDVLFTVMLSGTAVHTFVDVSRSFRSGVRRGDRTIPGPLARVRIPPYIDLPRVQLDQVSVPLLAYLGFARDGLRPHGHRRWHPAASDPAVRLRAVHAERRRHGHPAAPPDGVGRDVRAGPARLREPSPRDGHPHRLVDRLAARGADDALPAEPCAAPDLRHPGRGDGGDDRLGPRAPAARHIDGVASTSPARAAYADRIARHRAQNVAKTFQGGSQSSRFSQYRSWDCLEDGRMDRGRMV